MDRPVRFGLSEIVLRVRDVPHAARFYREVVGLLPDTEPSDTWAWLWTGSSGASARLGLTSRPLSFGAAHCDGKIHFAIAVARDRIPEEKSRLESRGLSVEGPVTFETWRADSIYFSDPDDHRVELCGFEHLNGRSVEEHSG